MTRRRGERSSDLGLLSSNAASGTGIAVRDQQCCHADEHRVRKVVEFGDAYPLRCVAKLYCGHTEQVFADDGDGLHGQVLAFAKLIDVRRM
jgi:hypothetical protein